MPVDWFRSPSWGDEDVAEFEKRLARSSLFNRPQYLRLKAMALDDAGLAAAADGLLERVIDEYPDSIFSALSLERRGDIFRRGGDLVAAEECYRDVIARRPDLNATSGTAPISLAEVIFELHGRAAVAEVRSLLNYPQMRLVFNIQMMRALVLSARAAEATGNVELRRSEAQRALDLVTTPS